MKRYMIGLSILLLTPASSVFASNVAFNAGVSVGLPGASVNLGVGAPAYPYRPVTIVEPPMFVQPPELGFHTAVGVPYDLFFLNNLFYLFSGNAWYSSPYYNGPWSSIYAYDVPYLLSRHPFHRIRHYRDHYYGYYKRYGRWDGYHHFRPERRHAGWGHGHHGPPGYAYSRPGHPAHHHGGMPAAYSRPYAGRHVHTPVYNRPGNPARFSGVGPGYNRPDNFGRNHPGPSYSYPSGRIHGNASRPVYTRPYSRHDGGGRTVAYTGPRTASGDSRGRPSFSGPSAPRHDSVGRPSFSRPASPSSGPSARGAASSPRGFGHGHGGHRGHGR